MHITKILTIAMPNLFFIMYLIGFLHIFLNIGNYTSKHIVNYILVPLLTIILSKILRKIISSRRPFEKFNINSLVYHRGGNSMPSNHSASAFAIAISIIYITNNLYLHITLIIFAIITALSRVLAGLHFPLDVLAGAILAFIVGFFCFFVI